MAAENDLRKPEALVPMGDYTMDEAQIMYDYCGIVIEDFAPLLDEDDPTDAALAEELEQRLKNPGFTKALLHISYRRANPRTSEATLRRFFGTMDRTEAMERFMEISGLEEEEESPPALTTEPDESSPRSSVESSESSGSSSTKNSGQPDDRPETTGTSESDTSSPALAPVRSVS